MLNVKFNMYNCPVMQLYPTVSPALLNTSMEYHERFP